MYWDPYNQESHHSRQKEYEFMFNLQALSEEVNVLNKYFSADLSPLGCTLSWLNTACMTDM
jgi:hypothetical protein